ncbi:hypothetical protein D3C86_1419580 [compost metagenome]
MDRDYSDHVAPPALSATLATSAQLLETELLPQLAGALALKLRMVIRQLRIGERELRLGQRLRQRESQRMTLLVGPTASLAKGRAMLAGQIRERSAQADPRVLREHVWYSTQEWLAIDNPDWATSPPADASHVQSHRNPTRDKK